MSYINCYNDNYYKPGKNLSELFQELVVKPFESPEPLTQAWIDHVENRDFEYHRKTILGQGRTNFDEPFEGLTPKEKVLIYCLHYMPMHLFSSYHIFTKHLAPVSDKVIFIDFGCGPLTSGIAFWAAFAGHRDITYIGIDKSESMRHKANEMNQGGGAPFFTKSMLTSNYDQLNEYLGQYIARDNQTQILFNFCYFLASNTLDRDDLSNCLTHIVSKYSQHKMGMVYQNPINSPDSHRNWLTVKGDLSTFKGHITELNEERFSCDWFRLQNGRLGWRRNLLPIDVYFDILSYEPSGCFVDSF